MVFSVARKYSKVLTSRFGRDRRGMEDYCDGEDGREEVNGMGNGVYRMGGCFFSVVKKHNEVLTIGWTGKGWSIIVMVTMEGKEEAG